MSSRRNQRVCELLKVEISRLMSREQCLEGMLLTVVDVSLAPDFKQATIFFSSLNPRLNIANTEALLNESGHHWHRALGQRVRLKYTPRLTFKFDPSLERGDRVLNLLQELEAPAAATNGNP